MEGKVTVMKRYGMAFLLVLFICSVPGMGLSLENDSNVKETEGAVTEISEKTDEHNEEFLSNQSDTSGMNNSLRHQYVQAPRSPEDFIRSLDRNGERTSYRNRRVKSQVMIMYRLVDHLNLDEDTATEFFPIYFTYVKERDKLMDQHRELILKIAKDADDESTPIRDLENSVAELEKNEKSIESARDEFMKKAKSILDERQYIKLVVFNDKLKEDLIMQFRFQRMREAQSRSEESGEKREESSDWRKKRE